MRRLHACGAFAPRGSRRAALALSLLVAAAATAAEVPAAPDPAAAAPGHGTPAVGTWRDPATGIEFALVPGGEFSMGSAAFANERPVHRVRVASFWLAKTEVTQAQWKAVVGTSPSAHARCDDCPVERVSWDDVRQFLRKTGYLLPTEAQWEYAAGGGAAHQRWAGTNRLDELGEYAWYLGNSDGETRPVARKRPNLFGLFDMSGNVYEWCSDWYGEDYYRVSPVDDPPGPAAGTTRVARGGSWILDPMIAGVTFRLKALAHRRRGYIGFRPVLPGGPR